jgi:phosphoserine phosphatase RsbU/P
MSDLDSAATQKARIPQANGPTATGITDPYIREQLERRRTELTATISVTGEAEQNSSAAELVKLLHEVDSALQRMEAGTYGMCDLCHDTIEKERLIADPLTRFCLDHLSGEEQRALERDLELASRIQRGLLPEADLRFGDWLVHYQYKPAGIVSGDYCDVITSSRDEGTLVFLLGDVSGKGVAAAMLMSHLHAMFRSLSGAGLDLDKLLEVANSLFCESTLAGQYATLICGRVVRGSGDIEYASAGHAPALLVTRTEVKQIGSTGMPLGMFRGGRFGVQRVRLEPGDTLLLFTDGILEANAPGGEEYGLERISVAAHKRRGLGPSALASACLEDVERHSGRIRQADDQTVMIVQCVASAAAA